jgi:hypothetical protein
MRGERKTPLNFPCGSNSGAGTEKRPFEDGLDITLFTEDVK